MEPGWEDTEDKEKRKDRRLEQVDVEPKLEETEDEGERRKDCRLEQVDVKPGWEETEDKGKDHRLEGLEGVRGQVDVRRAWMGRDRRRGGKERDEIHSK